jgi:DNA recombination protein Rad52
MSGFSPQQLKKLVGKLDRSKVKTRERDGQKFDYIEGWFAVAEANAIFGFAGWDREMAQCDRVFETREGRETACGYLARVRVTVRAGQNTIVREGTGFGEARAPLRAHAHERALKAAETDATKRALATFGNRFGLGLYDKEQTGVSARTNGNAAHGMATPTPATPPSGNSFALCDERGAVFAGALSAQGFCSGLRQLAEAARTGDILKRLLRNNLPMLERLRAEHPGLRSGQGRHFADILEGLLTRKLKAFDPPPNVEGGPARLPAEPTHQTLVAGANGHDGNAGVPPGGTMARKLEGFGPPPDVGPAPLPAEPTHQALAAAGNGHDLELGAQGGTLASNFAAADDGVGPEADEPNRNGAAGEVVATLGIDRPQNGDHVEACSEGLRPSRIGQGLAIDKSRFAVPTTKRLRSKVHLRYVASQFCLICGGNPCHAHHLAFAQARGLSLKVSDEFTVPLCVIHHNALHSRGNERAFWRFHRIDPLPEAKRLWGQTISQSGQSS